MSNINDDIRNLLSKFDSTENSTLTESNISKSDKKIMENGNNDDIRNLLSKIDSSDKSVLTESDNQIESSDLEKEVSAESKSFDDYLGETERKQSAPVTGDVLQLIVNEEISIEMPVVEHDNSGYTLIMDEVAESFLEACDCTLEESEYQGRDVELNQPMRGDVKKYKVYVKDPKTGNVKKVNFGSKEMEIKRDDPEARKSFRARHKCDQKSFEKDRTSAGYWSCRMWQSGKSVSDILAGK